MKDEVIFWLWVSNDEDGERRMFWWRRFRAYGEFGPEVARMMRKQERS